MQITYYPYMNEEFITQILKIIDKNGKYFGYLEKKHPTKNNIVKLENINIKHPEIKECSVLSKNIQYTNDKDIYFELLSGKLLVGYDIDSIFRKYYNENTIYEFNMEIFYELIRNSFKLLHDNNILHNGI